MLSTGVRSSLRCACPVIPCPWINGWPDNHRSPARQSQNEEISLCSAHWSSVHSRRGAEESGESCQGETCKSETTGKQLLWDVFPRQSVFRSSLPGRPQRDNLAGIFLFPRSWRGWSVGEGGAKQGLSHVSRRSARNPCQVWLRRLWCHSGRQWWAASTILPSNRSSGCFSQLRRAGREREACLPRYAREQHLEDRGAGLSAKGCPRPRLVWTRLLLHNQPRVCCALPEWARPAERKGRNATSRGRVWGHGHRCLCTSRTLPAGQLSWRQWPSCIAEKKVSSLFWMTFLRRFETGLGLFILCENNRVSEEEEGEFVWKHFAVQISFLLFAVQVTDMSFFGKPLKEGYDSHHVFVKANKFTPVVHRHDAVADEIVFDGTERILPHYIISFRRKSTRLVWLVSHSDCNTSALQQTMSNSVTTAGHMVQVVSSLEDAKREIDAAKRSSSEECEEVLRFAVTGQDTVPFLSFLNTEAPDIPVIVLCNMLEFDRHIAFVSQAGCHANMVTYSPRDAEMFVNASLRDLVIHTSASSHLVSFQLKSFSHPIAAAASRLQPC